MANLTPASSFDNVYQLETSDPVLGGAGGIANAQAQALANRTEWLKTQNTTRLLRNSQARSNVVLTGKYDSATGAYNALSAPAANTLRLAADSSFPFIVTGTAGFDILGEIAQVAKTEANLELNTAALPNRDFVAIVQYTENGNLELYYFQENLFYATPYEPTPPSDFALWYNPATGISKTGGDGSPWVTWRTIPVGRFTKSGGSIASVETFPYRQPFYCEETPAGTVISWVGAIPPRGGYLPCDGSDVNRLRYSQLFAAIGTTFGVGDGSTTFELPTITGTVDYYIKF